MSPFFFIVAYLALVNIFRKQFTSANMIGFFNVFYVIFVGLGLLTFPLYKELLNETFPTFYISRISNSAFQLSLVVFLAGTFIVNIIYFFLSKSKGDVTLRKMSIQLPLVHDMNERMFYALFFGMTVLQLYFVSQGITRIGETITLSGSDVYLNILDSRSVIGGNYYVHGFLQTLYPTLTLATFVRLKATMPHWSRRLMYFIALVLCVLGLLSMFKKGPLMVFLLQLALAQIFLSHWQISRFKGGRLILAKRTTIAVDLLIILKRSLIALPFGILVLMGLYFVYQGYYLPYNTVAENALFYFNFVLSRVFGRLSVPALFYCEFFPTIQDFYGFRNVGLFSILFGTTLFRDSRVVFSYFTKANVEGSVASSVFFDFYGQNGLYGVLIGSIILGLLIFAIDYYSRLLQGRTSGVVLWLCIISLAYYLTQASLFRSLAGYGGIFYGVLWLLLFFPLRRKTRQVSPRGTHQTAKYS